jgi:cephalosporin hydroxylase
VTIPRLTFDGDRVVIAHDDGGTREIGLGTPEAFRLLTRLWLRSGWDTKYVYGFTWMGRPIIQLPEDLVRVQEVLYAVRPDVLIETGVAHGGSLVFYAGLFRARGHGRVIGVDVEIRPHNRRAIEAHELADLITLVEGGSTDPVTVSRVRGLVSEGERVAVMLDSNHEKRHVLDELKIYGELVSPGSYIVAADGIMADLAGAPRSRPDWGWNNPKAAAEEFVRSDPRFTIEEPAFPFNEGEISERVTYWPSAFIRRRT